MKRKQTKAEMRVVIAKDVLLQLKKKKFIPLTGNYCLISKLSKNVRDEDQLQQELKQNNTCTVCALGACFASSVLKYNDFCVADVDLPDSTDEEVPTVAGSNVANHLRKYFTRKQLGLIEYYFERGMVTPVATEYFNFRAPQYLHDFDISDSRFGRMDDRKRMTLIMKNIIKNKGEFKHMELFK